MNRERRSSANKVGKKSKSAFSILIASILLLTLTYPIAAEVLPPAGYYGSLEIDGKPAPAGTTIIAKIGDEVRGQLITDKPGEYGSLQEPLWVTGYEPENNSATVTFYADGEKCSPTASWISGEIERVDLTFTFSMTLSPGWLLISTPWQISPSDVQTIRETQGLNFSISEYNTATGLWETPEKLQPLHGYWINMYEAGTINFTKSIEPQQAPPSRLLIEGWDLIGPSFGDEDPLGNGLNAAEVLASLTEDGFTNFSHLVVYNETTGMYTTYTAVRWEDVEAWNLILRPGQGCWLGMKEEDTLLGRL